MQPTDIGAHLTSRFGGAGRALAAGAGDNTEVDGGWVDRTGKFSAKVVISYTTTLAQDETLSFTANLQDASDSGGTGAADFGTAYAKTVVATGGTGGSTETGVVEIGDFNLMTADNFIQAQITPDLSASGTDVATWGAVIVLGGAETLPAS
jgi:hypothetical protein